MKKALLFPLVGMLMILSGFSQQPNEGKLSISTTGDNKILVTIGESKYLIDNHDLTFRQLKSGVYSLKIYRLIRNDLSTQEWGNFKNIFQQDITIKNGVHTEITVNRFGNCCINQMEVVTYNKTDEWNESLYVNNDPWLKVSANNNTQDRPFISVMSDGSFQEFKQLMKGQLFDAKMISFFENNIKHSLVSVQQVKELCLLLMFDRYKLELAKYAFDYTADKGNYFMIYSVFQFDSYKKELEDYIKNK